MNPESQGVKTWQWVVTVLVIIILIVLAYFMFRGNSEVPSIDVNNGTSTGSTLGGADRVIVTDQFPGNIVYISSAQLANPGFVVIQEDNAGVPGNIIGSQYFDKGTNPGRVTLTKNTMEGGLYYAVIYADTNGDKVFNSATDMPIKDSSGNTIMRTFRATSSVTEIKA